MKILFVFGTRPEAIKMAPLIFKAAQDSCFDVKVCVTGQHSELLYQVLNFFSIKPDDDLEVMRPNQSLYDITADVIKSLEGVIRKEEPDLVMVQGDTTTAFAGALAAFYKKIPVAHIEAGLRSFNPYSPFPEEINRALVSRLATYHFVPTIRAEQNLLNEGIKKNVFLVGNTVIDALFVGLETVKKETAKYMAFFEGVDFSKRIILVTSHRRENFGEPFSNICAALDEISKTHDVEIVYPVHLNPNVRGPVFEILGRHKNIHLIEPLSYPYLIWLMNKAYLIITDSGGIQEEAPSLGKPVLVIRDVTERTEGIEAGTCRLVGTHKEKITESVSELFNNENLYEQMSRAVNPYGDGNSAERIMDILKSDINL